LNEAIQLDPKNAVAYANRGEAYKNKGNRDRAIDDLDEAVRLGPHIGSEY
jgi:tetratricopeptide (TPR) repeat protein